MAKRISLNLANYSYNNSDSADRSFDMSCNVQVQNNEYSSCDAGEVRDKETLALLCSFNSYSKDSINYSFYSVTQSVQISIIQSIAAFVEEIIADLAQEQEINAE